MDREGSHFSGVGRGPAGPSTVVRRPGTSTDSTAKAAWIQDVLQTELSSNYPNIRAIIWTNYNDPSVGQYPIEDSSADESAWQQGIANPYYQASDPTDSFGGAIQDMNPSRL